MEPSIIIWWKNGRYHRAKQVFHTEQEINRYYARNRNRVNALMIVVAVKDFKTLSAEVRHDLGISVNNTTLTAFIEGG